MRGNCTATRGTAQCQEREATSITTIRIKHEDDAHFIVNTHALHNAHILRAVFSPDLFLVQPCCLDRKQYHMELAKDLAANEKAKKKAANEKRAATLKRKAEAKVAAEGRAKSAKT